MQLSIIIVNYNVRHFLEQCLASVRLATQGLAAEVLVADNASTDGSLAYLQPRFPEVQWLPLPHNVGFARANNLALQQARGRYILFLNPDTIVAEDTLQQTLSFMEANPQAGALGIRMIDGSGRFLPESKRGFPTPAAALYKQVGLCRLFPRSARFSSYYMGHLSQHSTQPVPVLAGAFMLVKKSVLEEVGSFDERFFMYGEDIDLSYRITQAGYRNYYFADSTILHFKGESSGQQSLRYVRVFYQAMQLFVQKHFKGSGAFLYRGLLYAAIAARACLSAAGRLLGRSVAQANIPAAISWQAVGWPQQLAQPSALLINGQPVPITWMDELAAAQQVALLLVPGDSLSVKQAIEKLQHADQRPCWIHLAHTGSVLLSYHKNKAGLSGEWIGGAAPTDKS
ncbi:MAG: glycosyltransferase family 2 protein [Chitinophagaceae bacterium]|jgi:GT2 family glycosyltransferase|nr:glycosyltransferase family 2 protein [Chitinophagaceae bacterium]